MTLARLRDDHEAVAFDRGHQAGFGEGRKRLDGITAHASHWANLGHTDRRCDFARGDHRARTIRQRGIATAETPYRTPGEQLVGEQASRRPTRQQYNRHAAAGATKSGGFSRAQCNTVDRKLTRLG
jgi:hypothetical protein